MVMGAVIDVLAFVAFFFAGGCKNKCALLGLVVFLGFTLGGSMQAADEFIDEFMDDFVTAPGNEESMAEMAEKMAEVADICERYAKREKLETYLSMVPFVGHLQEAIELRVKYGWWLPLIFGRRLIDMELQIASWICWLYEYRARELSKMLIMMLCLMFKYLAAAFFWSVGEAAVAEYVAWKTFRETSRGVGRVGYGGRVEEGRHRRGRRSGRRGREGGRRGSSESGRAAKAGEGKFCRKGGWHLVPIGLALDGTLSHRLSPEGAHGRVRVYATIPCCARRK